MCLDSFQYSTPTIVTLYPKKVITLIGHASAVNKFLDRENIFHPQGVCSCSCVPVPVLRKQSAVYVYGLGRVDD